MLVCHMVGGLPSHPPSGQEQVKDEDFPTRVCVDIVCQTDTHVNGRRYRMKKHGNSTQPPAFGMTRGYVRKLRVWSPSPSGLYIALSPPLHGHDRCKCSECKVSDLSTVHSFRSPLGLWVGSGQQRHIVPPPPSQWGASVLLPIGQRLGQRLPLALGQQQDGQHGQQCQRRVDHVVQEVTVVVPQVHERGAEAAHAAQREHCSYTSAPVDTRQLQIPYVTHFIC